MALPALIPLLLPALTKIFDKVLPDEKAREQAKLELLREEASQEIRLLETQMSAIVAEAKSSDPYTSRARPSFLYVIYVYVLAAIPMGFIFAFSPTTAADITTGVGAWLESIPDSMWTLFGTGYLGYVGARSWDKSKLRQNNGNR